MRAWLVLGVIVMSLQAARAETPSLPDRDARMLQLARVWAQAKFFHPTLATKDIDWDTALVTAIPKVEAATTIADYKAALQGMLAVIGDPATRVVDAPAAPPTASTGAQEEWLTWPSPGVLEVHGAVLAPTVFDYVGIDMKAGRIATEAATAKTMIIDLRGSKEDYSWAFDQIVAAMPAFDEWPTSRYVEHRGYRTQDGNSSGDYFSTFVTSGAKPPHPAPKAGPAYVVFVLDADVNIPAVALALQAAGKATFVSAGPLRSDGGDAEPMDVGGGLQVTVRVSEPTWGPPHADVTVTGKVDLLARARELAKRPPKSVKRSKKPPVLAPLLVRDEADYADTPYPTRERRLLAGIRMWAVVDRFEPYRYLAGDWDGALREMLPRLDKAADKDAYLRVMKELAARVGDGHVNVWNPAARAATPRGAWPFETRLVEGKLAIIRVLDAGKPLGIGVGDVIETVDGKPVTRALADLRPVTSGSTDEARDQRVAEFVGIGDDGTSVKLGVRDAAGKTHEITATRKKEYLAALWAPQGSAPHWKKLPGNIGYADLTLLTVPEVPTMFADLASTKALVFDMRGYPNGTAWSIAPRINTKHAQYGAQFLAPLVRGYGTEENLDERTRFLQPLPKLGPGDSIYTGKIVVLVDDRAISQSEHTCLFFEQAAGATFIGSPTHGANGDVTIMRLPGGLRMTFTGQEVRHVDGRQLQRVGIQPSIVVRPTLAGIRAGKDEVLDRALAFVANGK